MKKVTCLFASLVIFAFNPAWGEDFDEPHAIGPLPSAGAPRNSEPTVFELPRFTITGKEAPTMGWDLVNGHLFFTANDTLYEFSPEGRKSISRYPYKIEIEAFSVSKVHEGVEVNLQFDAVSFGRPFMLKAISAERAEALSHLPLQAFKQRTPASLEHLPRREQSKGYKSLPMASFLCRDDLMALVEERAGLSTLEGDYELSPEDRESLKHALNDPNGGLEGCPVYSKFMPWGGIVLVSENMKMQCTRHMARPLRQVLYVEEVAAGAKLQLYPLEASSSGGDSPPPSSPDSSKSHLEASVPPSDTDSASKMMTDIVSNLVQQVAGRASLLANARLSDLEKEVAEPVQNSRRDIEARPLLADGPPTEPLSPLMEIAPAVVPAPVLTPALPPAAILVEPVVSPLAQVAHAALMEMDEALLEVSPWSERMPATIFSPVLTPVESFIFPHVQSDLGTTTEPPTSIFVQPQPITQAVAFESPRILEMPETFLRHHLREGEGPVMTVFLQASAPKLMPLKERPYGLTPASAGMTAGQVETLLAREFVLTRLRVGEGTASKLKFFYEKQKQP